MLGVRDIYFDVVVGFYWSGFAHWMRVYIKVTQMWQRSGSQLRPNRWRDKECEQKVSNMEQLIVLLIVSLQFFSV